MSLEEGLKGLSIFQKHPHWLTELKDLFALEFKEPWDIIEFPYKEKDWENIPFVIPRSIVVLEKRLNKVQGWCKVKHGEIAKLTSGEFFDQIRAEMKGEKLQEMKYKEEVAKKFDSIQEKFNELYSFEENRKELEAQEVKEEGFFDQFFSEMNVNLEENEYKDHVVTISKKDEYEKLRKFSFRQLHYFFFKFLNRSNLRYRVTDIEEKLKEIDERLDKLYSKDLEIERKIHLEKQDLRKEILPQFDDVYKHIEDNIVQRLNADESMLQSTLETIEEVKAEAEENKAFRENLINKVDAVTKKTNSFTTFFEGKLNQMLEDIKVLKAKTEERLNEFENLFNENVQKIITEFEAENERGKNDFLERMAEYQTENKEFLEKFTSSITKTMNVLQFETKRTLETFSDELHINIDKFADKYSELDLKLDDFIGSINKFNIYVKTKIEPAFQSQAKIDLVESRIQEQEDFSMKSALFIREIVKKLIIALQKHNLDHKKKDEEPRQSKSDANTTFYVTELPGIALNKENENGDNKPETKFSPYDGFGLRANVNAARFKSSKNKFAPISVEGNTITQSIPPKSANAGERNPRNASFDLQITDAFKNINETFYKALKEKGVQHDPVLHKRLEVLKKALLDEEKVLPVNNKRESSADLARDPIKNFKDLPLVKVDERGVSRRHNRRSSALNKTFTEFGDDHLKT